MHQTCPLPNTHPEFSVIQWPGFTEYRVEHWRLARDGSGRVVRGTCLWSWVDVGVLVVVIVILSGWIKVPVSRPVLFVGVGIVFAYLARTRVTQVLYESLLVFPALGIQLETHYGHPLFPIPLMRSTTHHFVPLSALEDVVLHEGFRSAITSVVPTDSTGSSGGSGGIQVRVAFENINILPYFSVLKEVYLGVQETVFPPPTRIVESADDQPDHDP